MLRDSDSSSSSSSSKPSSSNSSSVRSSKSSPEIEVTPVRSSWLVHPRAEMAVGIHRVSAPAARRTACLDDVVGALTECGGLAAVDVQPDVAAIDVLDQLALF